METAVLLGRQFDSYIEGIPVSPNVPAFLAAKTAEGDTSFLNPAVRRDRAQSSQLHFETFMQARGFRVERKADIYTFMLRGHTRPRMCQNSKEARLDEPFVQSHASVPWIS